MPTAPTAGASRSQLRLAVNGELLARTSRAAGAGRTSRWHWPESERGLIVKNVLILGVNGFIGHHLSKYILAHTDWHIYGMDLQSERRRHVLRASALPLRRRRHHHQPRVGRIPRPQVRRDPAAGGDRDTRRPTCASRCGSSSWTSRRTCPSFAIASSTRSAWCSRRPRKCTARRRDKEFDPDTSELVLGPIHKQRWIYSCVQAAARPHHLGLWPTGPAVHPVPALQLGGLGPRQHGRSEGGEFARADPVPGPHRARRADQAGGRRQPDPRLHLHRRCGRVPDQDHRQPGRHRRRQDLQHRQSAQLCTRSASWPR